MFLSISYFEDKGGRHCQNVRFHEKPLFNYLALSHDQITGFHRKGGAGKTFVFTKLAKLAALEGGTTRAFAPTLSAVETLNEEGLSAVTLQCFLLSKAVTPSAVPELWLLDESSMVGALDKARR